MPTYSQVFSCSFYNSINAHEKYITVNITERNMSFYYKQLDLPHKKQFGNITQLHLKCID